MKKLLTLAAAVFFTASVAEAAIVSYDISWTGANGFSLTGNFSFDGMTAGNEVDETELVSFAIEGFDGGSSLGTNGGSPENFNFNAVAGAFFVGGNSFTDLGQRWNATGSGVGFESGSSGQSLYIDGSFHGDSQINVDNSTLQATLSTVPLPAGLPLYATGIAALGFVGWRKKKKAAASA